MSHSEIQRRTAEQIVDLPAPVFTERILAKDLGAKSAFIEAAKTPSPRPELAAYSGADYRGLYGRGHVSNYGERLATKEVIEAAETSSRCRILQRTVEQDFVEVDKTTSQERISGRMGFADRVIEVPRTLRQESAEVVKSIAQERTSERSQVIEVPKISCW